MGLTQLEMGQVFCLHKEMIDLKHVCSNMEVLSLKKTGHVIKQNVWISLQDGFAGRLLFFTICCSMVGSRNWDIEAKVRPILPHST